jgi:4-amino-4-deoxy-L-arabinose transferase-like glycosyltransferase
VSGSRIERWADPIVCAVSVAYGIAVWWPTRSMPYYWDSATFVVDAARDLLATHFDPLVAGHSDFAHPPLFVATLALAWRIFGDGRVVSHALVLPALPAAMVGTYLLGKRVADRVVGASSALLFGGVAFVVAEAGQVYMDLPVGAILTLGLVAWLAGRRLAASLLLCAATAAKLPYPLLVPSVLAVLLAFDPVRRRGVRSWLALAAPFVVLGVWLGYHRAVTGWLLMRPERVVRTPLDASALASALGTACRLFVLGQWRWLALVAGAAGVVWVRLVRRRPVVWRPVLPLIALVGAGLVFFAAVGELALRYAIFLLPPYLVACATLARAALPRPSWLLPGAAGVFALFATTWHPRMPRTTTYVFRPDEDLGYLDMITIGEKSSRWLEQTHPEAEIFGAGPEAYELTEPHQGYVSSPLKFSDCSRFQRRAGVEQLVIVHGYHPGQPLCRRLTEATGARTIKHFESNGKWLEIYEVPPGDGA